MKCKNCGNEILANENICSKCGNVVTENEIVKSINKQTGNNKNRIVIFLLIISLILIGVGIYFSFNDKNNDTKLDDIEVITQIITFNTNGGNEIDMQKVTSGEKLKKPTDPIKDGYIFDHWELNGEEYDFDKIVTSSFELVAVWEEKIVGEPFLFQIEDVFTITGRGTVVTGVVNRGKVKIGDTVQIIGLNSEIKTVVVDGIEMFRKEYDEAKAGESVGIRLKDVAKSEVKKGQVLAKPGSITAVFKFDANIINNSNDNTLVTSNNLQFSFRNFNVEGSITLSTDIDSIGAGDEISPIVTLTIPIALEMGTEFSVKESGKVIATGKVTKIY